jgi:hypothetical protein
MSVWFAYALETKDGPTQNPGFTRPFLGCVRNARGKERFFRNDPRGKSLGWRERPLERGGCLDELFSSLLVKANDGGCFYAFNAAPFDHMFLLAWLNRHSKTFEFGVEGERKRVGLFDRTWEDVRVKEVWVRGNGGLSWYFRDSVYFLDRSLLSDFRKKRAALSDEELRKTEGSNFWRTHVSKSCRDLAVGVKAHEERMLKRELRYASTAKVRP